MTLKNYIENKKQNKYNILGIHVEEYDVPENISVRKTVESALGRIPRHLTAYVKHIKVGPYSALRDRNIQAMYKDNTIYATNIQKNSDDLLDDIVHEFAHSIEDYRNNDIYGDGTVEREFLLKREKMWSKLKSRGLEYDLRPFLNSEYDEEFDNFLHGVIGYDTIRVMTRDIFYSPYASTSLREYFANGFEAFFMKEEVKRLKDISPTLYEKIVILMDNKDEI
tara:strand:+ start:1687 stop:2355 length:669 start_codon:yes stop_codon:yes gene_type:complete